ncbi:MAG: hypothetical protein SFZ23_12210 [Planctomycetota bacterium]|nr:hypothetical protein [Planctomycetota bacterium]
MPGKKTRIVRALAVSMVVATLAGQAAAQQTLDNPVGRFFDMPLDSGMLDNPGDVEQVVFSAPVELEPAQWLRLYFAALELPQGSSIRMTSLRDGEVQTLDADAAQMWQNSSAYFNGNLVAVELVAGPRTVGNRLVLQRVAFDPKIQDRGEPGECGICDVDDRQPSTDLASGRLMPAGCSASVYCESGSLTSAGHCGAEGGVIQFNVPPSNSNCGLVNPPVADQFPVTATTGVNQGVGADWRVIRTGINSQGQTVQQRYNSFRRFAGTAATTGSALQIFGYGIDRTCDRNQVQQLSPGVIGPVGGNSYEFNNDVRGGNSGSGMVVNNFLVGVVTHCSPQCGNNLGTRGDKADFRAARDAACVPAFRLDVSAAPSAPSVAIGVAPADINNMSNGTTLFSRTFFRGEQVTLTAPESNGNGVCFASWTINGAVGGRDNAITLTINANTTARANYSAAGCCPADYNRDGQGDFFDYLDFAQDYGTDAPAADFNRDGQVDFFDYLDYVAAFDRGC